MIYLASPYSAPDPDLRSRRFISTREFIWHQMELGVDIFSPIVYCHQFARDFGAPISAVAWQHFNEELYQLCDTLWVLCLDGWKDSYGVSLEIDWAEKDGKPIVMKEPLPYASF